MIIIALLFRYATGQRTVSARGLTTSGNLVILEPEKWIGQKLPIAEFTDADLSNGEWTVVLHRHDCPACQEAIPHFEQLALMGRRVALIEIPPYGYSPSGGSACFCCRLKDDQEWFVETPVEIQLLDGVVQAVKSHGH